MKLSIRTKILGGYSFTLIIFLAIILNVIITQRSIRSKLLTVNEDYLPKLTKANVLPNYLHLDESFDVAKIIQNASNKMLIQTMTVSHPRLLANQLGELSKSTAQSIEGTSYSREKKLLELILSSIDKVDKMHAKYLGTLTGIIKEIDAGRKDKATAMGPELARERSFLKSEITLLRKRLDNGINSNLREISGMERGASIVTGVLSLLAIIIAGAITLFALYTLAPIRKLIEGVKKISTGDYSHKVEIKSEGEMKNLAVEFNKMSESILERNNALREQQRKLLQSERMAIVGRMASHITHEIKNPLNSMSLNTDLLEDELNQLKNYGDTAEAFSLLTSMKKEIERLSLISEEYLSFARLPKGDKQKIRIEEVLKEITALTGSELKKGNINLVEKYDDSTLPVYGDVNQYKQAFLNIIKNAIEALLEGGTIAITTSFSDGKVRISIEDDGKGIPQDIIDRIFDPFFSTKEKGTGLGLPLTQKIINEQGGEISCRSRVGEYTRFEINLPSAKEERTLNAHA